METSARCASGVLYTIVGPTASGKLDLILELVCVLPGVLGASGAGEIVSADALQLCCGMDVGMAKIPVEEHREITHHQIDVLEVRDKVSVAAYQKHVRADVAGTHEREDVTMVAEGSGLYQHALLDVVEFPGADPAVRARPEEEAEGPMGPCGLHDRLAQLDPVSTERIDPYNAHRTIRASEVIELTRRPYSTSMPRHEFAAPSLAVVLRRPMEELDGRIAVRAHTTMDDELIEEVRALIDVGLREAKTASRATEHIQALAVIDGQMGEGEVVESITLTTHQLARHQVKWLQPDPRIRWLDTENFDSNKVVTRHVVESTQHEVESPLGRS